MKKCPACASLLFKKEALIPTVLEVSTCQSCGLRISTFLKREHGGYEIMDDTFYENSIALSRKIQAKTIVKMVKKVTPKKAKWLDIGCGVGILLGEAKRAGFSVLGVDPDPKAIRLAAQALGKQNTRQAIMNQQTVSNNSQHVISSTDLLEHIPAPQVSAFLKMVHSKLKKDGIYIVKVPSSEGLYFAVTHLVAKITGNVLLSGVKRMWLVKYAYPHTLYFNANSLQKLLKSHGFKIVKTTYLNEIPNETIFARIRMDQTIPLPLALLSVPLFYILNFIEKIRGKSDSLLLIAQKASK